MSQTLIEFISWLRHKKGIILAEETNDCELPETYYPTFQDAVSLAEEFLKTIDNEE